LLFHFKGVTTSRRGFFGPDLFKDNFFLELNYFPAPRRKKQEKDKDETGKKRIAIVGRKKGKFSNNFFCR
jgi:hypothetical protein